MLTTTVCGSFRRHMTGIYDAVQQLNDCHVRVLSPSDPRVVDAIGDFVFVASDRGRSIKLVQDRHLAAIGSSDFVWLVAPDGYVGPSATLELGYALGLSIPVFCASPIIDSTLGLYVRQVPSVSDAVSWARHAQPSQRKTGSGQLLIDPVGYGEQYLEDLVQHTAQVADLRDVMMKPHSATDVEPLYKRVKEQTGKVFLHHD